MNKSGENLAHGGSPWGGSARVVALGVCGGTATPERFSFDGGVSPSPPPELKVVPGLGAPGIYDEAALRAATALRVAARVLARRWSMLNSDDRARALGLLVSAAERLEASMREPAPADSPGS